MSEAAVVVRVGDVKFIIPPYNMPRFITKAEYEQLRSFFAHYDFSLPELGVREFKPPEVDIEFKKFKKWNNREFLQLKGKRKRKIIIRYAPIFAEAIYYGYRSSGVAKLRAWLVFESFDGKEFKVTAILWKRNEGSTGTWISRSWDRWKVRVVRNVLNVETGELKVQEVRA
jgi:hypothetical protein